MVSNLEARGEHRWPEDGGGAGGWAEMAAKEATRQEKISEPVPGKPRSSGLGWRKALSLEGMSRNKARAGEKALGV